MKVDFLKAIADGTQDVAKAAAAGVSPQQFVPVGTLNQPVRSDWDFYRADRDGFKACSWVYACIDRLGGACSTIPWRVMKKKAKGGKAFGGEWEPTDDDPRALAIEYPNDIMSRQFMMTAGVQHLGIGGNSLWKNVGVTRARGNDLVRVPSEFWPLNPGVWRPVPNEITWISGYKRRDKPYEPALSVGEVIHTQFPDPLNLIWGLSPMRAIARVIDMDVEHVRWNAALSRNRMTPETAIVDRTLKSNEQLDEAADRLAARYAGPEQAGRPLMLGAGAEVLRLGLTPQEMAWIESRRFTLIEICAAFGLIPSLFVPDAKYSNQDVAVKYMWENGAMRFLSAFEDAFNTRLVARKDRPTIWVHFDLAGVPALSDSLEKRLEAHERAVRSAIPPNQSFVIFDIPCAPVEGGDKPLVLGTLVPLEQMLAEPDPETVDPSDALPPGDGTAAAGGPENDTGAAGDAGNG